MKTTILVFLFVLFFPLLSLADPPYTDSMDISPDIINETDSTKFVELVYEGIGERTVSDKRVNGQVTVKMFLFTAHHSDGHAYGFQVNPEFESVEASSTVASFYARIIGQLPDTLRSGIELITIHKGMHSFTAGGGHISFYTDYGKIWTERGRLEEVVLHEAAHISIDPLYNGTDEWIAARAADGEYISLYAHDFPRGEDMAESILAYFALRYKTDRIFEADADIIASTIPNRIAYFDSLNLNLDSLTEFPFQINAGLNDAWYNPATDGQGFFITVFPTLNAVSMAWFTYDTELPADGVQANLGDAGHRWITAVGPIVGNQAIMNIEMTSGGLFDAATIIDRTDPSGSDGTIILSFDSCSSGTVEYDIPSINRQGTVPIQRVAGDNIALCEALNSN
jgi:hypothetical protein